MLLKNLHGQIEVIVVWQGNVLYPDWVGDLAVIYQDEYREEMIEDAEILELEEPVPIRIYASAYVISKANKIYEDWREVVKEIAAQAVSEWLAEDEQG